MTKRWRAEVQYKTSDGFVTFGHHFDELAELQDLIEAGPDWESLERIEVRYNLIEHRDRVAELEAALRHIIGTAGHPDAAEGCRLIINRAKEALGS